MNIHLIAPKDKNKWNPIWHHCYKIFNSSPYTIKLWHDEEIDKELNNDDPDFFNILNKCPNIYKWDYFRYLLLEKYGGAYFDMDIEVKRDFFSLLDSNKIYLAGGYCSSGVEPSIMIANRNQFTSTFFYSLKLFIQDRVMKEDVYPNTWVNVVWKTGPWALSFYLNHWIMNNTDKNIDILPYDLFSKQEHSLSYSVHHFTNEWHEGESIKSPSI